MPSVSARPSRRVAEAKPNGQAGEELPGGSDVRRGLIAAAVVAFVLLVSAPVFRTCLSPGLIGGGDEARGLGRRDRLAPRPAAAGAARGRAAGGGLLPATRRRPKATAPRADPAAGERRASGHGAGSRRRRRGRPRGGGSGGDRPAPATARLHRRGSGGGATGTASSGGGSGSGGGAAAAADGWHDDSSTSGQVAGTVNETVNQVDQTVTGGALDGDRRHPGRPKNRSRASPAPNRRSAKSSTKPSAPSKASLGGGN